MIGVSRSYTQSQVRVPGLLVVASANSSSSNGKPGERNATVLMESTLKEMRDAAPMSDVDSKTTVGGGVEDVYGEDSATEEYSMTPWTVSVAR